MPINNIIKLRRGNAADWSAINSGDGPTLNAGEPGFEIDSNILKIGDGSTAWKDLKPIGADQSLYKVKNTSGGIIRKGQVVRANGTIGNSDAIQVTLFIADGSVPEYTIMGLATQDMNNNDFGYVTAFGIVKGIDTDPDSLSTNICAAGENWLDGDILYASPTASGKLTKNKPQHDTILAIVLNSADNGSLFARPTWNPHLDDVHDVNTSGVSNNQYLRYDSSSDTWLPTSSGIFNNVYASGSVGIGTSSVQAGFKLDIYGSSVTRGNVLSNGDISEFDNSRYKLSSGAASNSYSYVSNGAGARFGVGFIAPSGKLSVNGGASIGANYNLVPPTNGLIVEGGVGIGTTTPLAQLHVVDNLRLNSSTTNSVITINPSGRSINVSPSQFSDIILQVNDQNIFRGLDNWTATWADSVVTTYFQVGRSGGNTIFTSLVGNPFNRLAYSANKYLFTNQTSNIAVPSPYFNVEYNGASIIAAQTGGNVGIGTTIPSYKLQVNGSFGATTKSFRIDHPSRPNYTLEYGSLESPYHGVRLTGRGKVVKGSGVVQLPYYLKDLIHDDETINIQITNIKHGKTVYVDEIDLNNDQFTVKVDRAKSLGDLEFFWTFTGVRKDVDNLVVEQEK